MPPVLAGAEAAGGAAAARPAQAAQVVVPSGICAPHELQNAIAVSSSAVMASKIPVSRNGVGGKLPKMARQSNEHF